MKVATLKTRFLFVREEGKGGVVLRELAAHRRKLVIHDADMAKSMVEIRLRSLH